MGVGCSKKTTEKVAPAAASQTGSAPTTSAPAGGLQITGSENINELIASLQTTKTPYTGNLTPEKAAEITNSVAKVSLAEIPSKDLPKDPKVMVEINDRIRQKSDAIYSQNGTTMGEVMRYISDLSPQDREKYNKKLTDLFLEDSKKRAEIAAKEAPPQTVPKAEGAKGKK